VPPRPIPLGSTFQRKAPSPAAEPPALSFFNSERTLGLVAYAIEAPPALSTKISSSRLMRVSSVIAPPFVPIATEPMPEVPVIPVGCPEEPDPAITAASIPTLIVSVRSRRTSSSIPGVA